MRVAKVILAAGQSSRFNGCKLIADVGNKPMICRAVDTLQGDDTLPIYVISGAWHAQIEDALHSYKNVEILHNPHWQVGLGKSIARATQVISAAHALDGILFMLADQVELRTAGINTLIDHFKNNPSRWCADYGERIGVPAVFPACDFKTLAALSCDKGAQHLLRDTKVEVNTILLKQASTDIDTQQQLKQFINNNNNLTARE
ncbi:nucleotidyltransferase family protein [Pseudoalteromonas sp. S3776]|uniref:nucleotidyltransferase family protein n=1 Tax=Pseudoalteromonas sp. S3776 TaxID=579544 RepID=UPI001109A5AF|nr:nucleotidyltransferase family protein [Pseudoalteromonas sp. S3776]TMO81828.1 nucleotidyltransferase family protein [Pseudoalteromonas sp. S3776]